MNYFLWQNGTEYGPYDEETLRRAIQTNELSAGTLGRREIDGNWKPIGSLFSEISQSTSSGKSRSISGLCRKRFLVLGAVGLLLVLITSTFEYKPFMDYYQSKIAAIQEQRQREQQEREWEAHHAELAPKIAAAKEVLAEFNHIQSALDAGVSLADYSRLVLNVKISTDQILPRIPDEEWRNSLNEAMAAYIVARDFWIRGKGKREREPIYLSNDECEFFGQYGLSVKNEYIFLEIGLKEIWQYADKCSGKVKLIILIDEANQKSRSR